MSAYRTTNKEKIAIGADHGGFALKEKLKSILARRGLEVIDLGTYSSERCDYPLIAARLAEGVSRKRYGRGILICKSGIGNSIVANRFPAVRAALCQTPLAARLSREHNDSNVLVLGARFTDAKKARRILDAWLTAGFEGGRHRRRLMQLAAIEKKILRKGI